MTQPHTGAACQATSGLHLTAIGQPLQAFQQQVAGNRDGGRFFCLFHPYLLYPGRIPRNTAHQSVIPKWALAMSVMFSGDQRGSWVRMISAIVTPSTADVHSREPSIR